MIKVGLIAGSEEALCAAKETIVMLPPGQARTGTKALGHQLRILVHGRNGIESTCHGGRTISVSKHGRLFGREEKSIVGRIIANVPGGSLGTKPFPKLSLM